MVGERERVDVAIIGAGSIGISVAYYLVKRYGVGNVAIIDPLAPMSLTSAQSGENYRNWWPHPVMTAFTDDSIDLLEEIARATGNRINMTRRGYALVTRRDPAHLVDDLYRAYGEGAERMIRTHEGSEGGRSYRPAISSDWESAPTGVDVITDAGLIRKSFPSYAADVSTVVHIRRAGSISGQQLGQFMIEEIRAAGGRIIQGEVVEIDGANPFSLVIRTSDGLSTVGAERIVNAAGPSLRQVAKSLGEDLPVTCVYQQKISFEDNAAAVPRDMPFTIDMDGQTLNWTDEERELLEADPSTARLSKFMTGGIHCRPDGAENGKWIKLGWAFNDVATDPQEAEPVDDYFPDIVLRAASRLQPSLATYVGRLPRGAHHYGGYYTMTAENWPLIGPTRTDGAFVAGALSGFGTMAACSAGALCAAWIADGPKPAYADALSPSRYQDVSMMAELAALSSRGML